MIYKPLEEVPKFIAGDETRLRELLHPKNDNLDLPYSLAHASIPPGTKSLPHTLKGEEVYYILEGKGTVSIDGKVQEIKKGDTFVVPGEAEQFVENSSETDELVFLCIVSPPWSEDTEEIL